MKLLKNTLIPIIIVLLAATLIIVLALPLAGTEWADSFRGVSETSSEIASETSNEREAADLNDPNDSEDMNAPALLMIVLPIVKVSIFMCVGGLLTILIRRLSRRFMVSKQKTT